jgi:hypothetical protein
MRITKNCLRSVPVTVTHRSALWAPLQPADQPETKTVVKFCVTFSMGSLGNARSGPSLAGERAPTHQRSASHKVIHRFIYGQFGSSKTKSVFNFRTDCPNCPSVDCAGRDDRGAMGHLGSLGSRFSVALKYAYCEPFSIRKLF